MGKYNRKPQSRRGILTNPNLSLISVNLSDDILDSLTYGQAQGWWATRSEGARVVLNRGLTIIFCEKKTRAELIDSKIEINLDSEKDYVKIPGRGYIEIIGEA